MRAGGKFVWTCLCQSPQVEMPDDMSLPVYEQHVQWLNETNHREFFEDVFYRHYPQPMDENRYYVVIENDNQPDPNKRSLQLYNYEWILNRRSRSSIHIEEHDLNGVKQTSDSANLHLFDMESLLDKEKFVVEFKHLCNWLDIDLPNVDNLNHVRELFVNKCHYGW